MTRNRAPSPIRGDMTAIELLNRHKPERERELAARLSIRLAPRQMAQIEALAAVQGVSVACTVRSMLEHFLADDGGRAAELDRIAKMFRSKPRRVR